jgi:4-amino-4-deoxy-L-arabinose transferase-like glycosyltransferase
VSVVLKARIEIVLSALLGTATIVTAVWPTWIESLFGFDPDGGNGTAEWWIVAVLAVITIAAAALARRDLRVVRRRTSIGTP